MHFIMPRFFVNCERWKWNDDLRIYVSTHGHIKDEHKKNVAAKINGNGYFCVRVNGRFYTIHRLVLMTWRPLPNDGVPMTVDHLDSNRRNNHLDNLEWVSEKENLRRANENLIHEQCDTCKNYEPKPKIVAGAAETLGTFVTFEELYDRFGYPHAENKQHYYPEGFLAKVKELWINGEISIYKKVNGHVKISPAMVAQVIGNQPNPEIIEEHFLKKALTRSGKYFGWSPCMRWNK